MTEFVFGLDVGGTGIQCGLFEVLTNDQTLAKSHVWQGNLTTNKGIQPHVVQVASLVQMATTAAQERHGILVGIGVASPGRFRDGFILKGTSPNMGWTTHEFDGVCLPEQYIVACSHLGIFNLPIVVRNDADAMAIGLLEQHQLSPTSFPDQNGKTVQITEQTTIGYLGLGNGLGSSFLRSRSFINEGHLSMVKIAIDSTDVEIFSQVHNIRGQQMQYFDPAIPAANLESLVCMPTLRALAGLIATDEKLNVNIIRHQQAIDLVGKYLAKGMVAVRDGHIHDINPDNQWSDDDIAAAKSTSVYLLGGAVMRDSNVAGGLVTAINRTLVLRFGEKHGIQVVPMGCDNPAVYAAANLFMNEFLH